VAALKAAEAGTPIRELCRQHAMSNATFYHWRSIFGGMDVSFMSRMKELEEEYPRLKEI
jgi:putative transposase